MSISICKMENNKELLFTELKCWQKARELVKFIYKMTNDWKDYGTSNQLRRAVLSIMNNIAEGYIKRSDKETLRFLDISIGSAGEVISMSYVLEDMEYKTTEDILHIRNSAIAIYKMTNSLHFHISNKNKKTGDQS